MWWSMAKEANFSTVKRQRGAVGGDLSATRPLPPSRNPEHRELGGSLRCASGIAYFDPRRDSGS